jgi:hypothetical protein
LVFGVTPCAMGGTTLELRHCEPCAAAFHCLFGLEVDLLGELC